MWYSIFHKCDFFEVFEKTPAVQKCLISDKNKASSSCFVPSNNGGLITPWCLAAYHGLCKLGILLSFFKLSPSPSICPGAQISFQSHKTQCGSEHLAQKSPFEGKAECLSDHRKRRKPYGRNPTRGLEGSCCSLPTAKLWPFLDTWLSGAVTRKYSQTKQSLKEKKN